MTGESGERDLDLEAAFASRASAEGRVVGDCDRRDDREAEPDAVASVRAVGTETLERLREPLDLGGWDERSAVRDREHGLATRAAACRDVDPAAGHVVAQRVVDEIDDQPLGERGVARGRRRIEGRVHGDAVQRGVIHALLEQIGGE